MKNIQEYIKFYKLENIITIDIIDKVYLQIYSEGASLLKAHNKVKNIYFILKGKVEISYILANGKKLFINFLYPLELFGDIEYINRNSALFDVYAAEKTLVLILPIKIVDKYLYNNPFFLRFICEAGNKKLLKTNKAILLRKSLPLKNFFCNYLINKNFYITFKKLNDLAEELNVSYRNLTRIIKELVLEGIIEKNRYYIKVLNKIDILKLREDIL
ncbi:MAG: Crp/Fnr family transcriptional regulator [Fusobacteriaceae bacterium]